MSKCKKKVKNNYKIILKKTLINNVMSIFLQRKIGLVVCDMAGTIINEKGLIYKTMFNTLKTAGYAVPTSFMDTWPGKDKKDVIEIEFNFFREISLVASKLYISAKEYFEISIFGHK